LRSGLFEEVDNPKKKIKDLARLTSKSKKIDIPSSKLEDSVKKKKR